MFFDGDDAPGDGGPHLVGLFGQDGGLAGILEQGGDGVGEHQTGGAVHAFDGDDVNQFRGIDFRSEALGRVC